MNSQDLKGIFAILSDIMDSNRNYLIELDQQNGDGDLGVSMSSGFKAASDAVQASSETDLGQLIMAASRALNEAAPSTLGTILTLFLMGIAKSLRGKLEVTPVELADAMLEGITRITERAKSRPGEKTILDALYPGAVALKESDTLSFVDGFKFAYEKTAEGSESTREMKSVHGRAAHFADKSIGVLDGGSVAGKLIFEGFYNYFEGKE